MSMKQEKAGIKTPQPPPRNGVENGSRMTPSPHPGGVAPPPPTSSSPTPPNSEKRRGTKRRDSGSSTDSMEPKSNRPRLEMELRSTAAEKAAQKGQNQVVTPSSLKLPTLQQPTQQEQPKSVKSGFLGDDRAMTPTRMSRLDEKNTLVALNNRFAAIIDRNNHLENENAKLAAQVETVEKTLAKTSESMRSTFVTESNDLRAKLEHAQKEKAKSDLALNLLRNSLNDASTKVQSLQNENAELKKQLENAEADTAKAEADLKKQASETNKLKKALEDMTRDMKKLEAELAALRKSIEDKTVKNVELEHALKNKAEEMQMKQHVHQQELTTLKTSNSAQLQEIGGKLEKEYKNRLEDAINSLRDDCNKQIKAHKDEREHLYQMKEKDMKAQLDNNGAALKAKMDEMSKLMSQVEELSRKVHHLDGERHALASELGMAKEGMKREKDEMSRILQELEKRIKQLQNDKEQLINEYQDLMEVKVALDNEIATYRKLLEGEEQRLNIAEKLGKGAGLEAQIIQKQPVKAK